ncbi:hypothetical protein LPJ78_005629 [Coemansia sp. RSA 989]|nr:hypothetical protein LPJ68_006081 [Coemansia sp. RSA 1086]KAJ1860907.1 hypothetical protein LPJ78_005629 [Coemansia sp. RSA 989]KAJ2668774.1 hypothetical protein IWW42_004980 [Coemansia sp. RSA 1085]KAJ2668779.1 hypothetical protein IWW42_004985 [Coemansia sp. RSA 1085]
MGNKVHLGKVAKKKKKAACKVPLRSNQASEIDDIFSTKPSEPGLQDLPPSTDPKVVDATRVGKAGSAKSKLAAPPPEDDFGDSRGKNSKYTDDGLRVFYMEDLKIGQGEGDTDLCPFDCQCCF